MANRDRGLDRKGERFKGNKGGLGVRGGRETGDMTGERREEKEIESNDRGRDLRRVE